MRGLHRMNRLFFFLMRGRGRQSPRAKNAAKMDYIKNRSPYVAQYQRELQEILKREHANSLSEFYTTWSSNHAVHGGSGVLPEPQSNGADAGRVQRPTDGGSSTATVAGDNLGWEALEQELLTIVENNPDIREVEVKHE